MSRRLIGRKSLTWAWARKTTAFGMPSAVSTSASTSAAAPSDTSEQSVRFRGPGDERILLGHRAAEVEPQVLLYLRPGVGAAIGVVLGGDRRQRVRLVAVALEIALGDAAEDAGETALDAGLLLEIGGLEERLADRRAGQLGHLLDADHQHEPRLPGGDAPQPLMDRGRAGGAGVLDPGRRLEAKSRIGLQHERAGKILANEAAVEVAEIDVVDVGRRDARRRPDRPLRRLDDQILDAAGPRACRTAGGSSRRCRRS